MCAREDVDYQNQEIKSKLDEIEAKFGGQEIESRLAEMESKLECFDKKINVVQEGGGVSIVFGYLSVTESSWQCDVT